jgi:hypothetical protein
MIGREFLQQYLSYFSTDFLFAQGGLPMRYYVPDQGLWYYSYLLLFLVFLAIAIFDNKYFTKNIKLILSTKQQKKWLFYILYLLLLAALPAALTIDDVPNVHRAALMPIMFSILSGLMFFIFYQLPKRTILVSCFAILVSFESFYFFNKYAVHADKFQQVYRSPAIKNLAFYLNEQKSQFDDIYIEKKGEIAIYYLFYNQIFDHQLSNQFQKKLQIPKIDNLHFTDQECVHPGLIEDDLSQKNSLFIVSSSCFNDRPIVLNLYPKLKEVAQIKSAEGDLIFKAYQLEATQSAENKR